MSNFERETRVQKNNGGYSAELSTNWAIWGPSGGYLASIALRAAGDVAQIKRPVTFHGHYLRVAQFAPVQLEVRAIHQGTRSESIAVSMLQNGKRIFEGMLRTFATEAEGFIYDELRKPATSESSKPESLPLFDEAFYKYGVTFWKNFECRIIHKEYFDPDHRTESARFEQWARFKSDDPITDPFVDSARSIVLLDTLMWPAVYHRMDKADRAFIAPSLDITLFFHRGAMESRWLRVDTQAPIAEAGLIAGQGRTFDEAGRTVASGYSQMMYTPAPTPA